MVFIWLSGFYRNIIFRNFQSKNHMFGSHNSNFLLSPLNYDKALGRSDFIVVISGPNRRISSGIIFWLAKKLSKVSCNSPCDTITNRLYFHSKEITQILTGFDLGIWYFQYRSIWYLVSLTCVVLVKGVNILRIIQLAFYWMPQRGLALLVCAVLKLKKGILCLFS